VKQLNRYTKLPALICGGSFVALLILIGFTNPSNQVAAIIFFFLLLMVFMATLASWLSARLQKTNSFRRKMLIASIFLVLLAMFNSAGSLNIIDGLILALSLAGLGFYFDRRSA
jgi:uncharacterized membrane protein